MDNKDAQNVWEQIEQYMQPIYHARLDTYRQFADQFTPEAVVNGVIGQLEYLDFMTTACNELKNPGCDERRYGELVLADAEQDEPLDVDQQHAINEYIRERPLEFGVHIPSTDTISYYVVRK